jgi:AbrB family looped-hinge helix DNA binding protein
MSAAPARPVSKPPITRAALRETRRAENAHGLIPSSRANLAAGARLNAIFQWHAPWHNVIVRGTVSLDRAGRIVVPKSVRDRLRLSPGDTFDLVVQGDELTLRPRRSATPLQKERGVWVFRTGQPLTAAETDETLQMIRTQRNPP